MIRKYLIKSLSEKCLLNVVDVLTEFIGTEAIISEKHNGFIYTIDGHIWNRGWFVLTPINDYNLALNYALKLSDKDKTKLLKELMKDDTSKRNGDTTT